MSIEELKKEYENARLEGTAEVLAGLTYTCLFGFASVGVSYIGEGTMGGTAGQVFLNGMMLACANITNKDIDSLGRSLSAARSAIATFSEKNKPSMP